MGEKMLWGEKIVPQSWRLLGVLVITATLTGCVTVEPWERGTLAKKQMALTPYPLQSMLRTHVQNSREATLAGDTAAGGGCGCY